MRKAIAIALVAVLLGGCILSRKERDPVMRESMKYALIPAGTEFQAKLTKDGPLETLKLDRDVMAVDAGYLIQLQRKANRNALGIPND